MVTNEREHVFLNTAVVGAYPAVIRLRQRLRRWIGHWPAHGVAALWVWVRWPRVQLRIRTDHREISRHTAMLWIGTGPGSFPAPHEAPLPTREVNLELVILPSARRRHAVRLVLAVWAARRGRGPETVGLELLHAGSVVVDSRHHLRLTLDGEPLALEAPLHITLEPASLCVVCAEGDA